jgi:hypothetical protein
MSLTLPQPSAPGIVLAGRTNLTWHWTSDHFPADQLLRLREEASARRGFNLTVCEVAGLLGGASSLLDGTAEGCTVSSFSVRELSALSAVGSADEVAVQFRASVSGLRPGTAYKARWELETSTHITSTHITV